MSRLLEVEDLPVRFGVEGRAIDAEGPAPHAIIHHPDIKRTLSLMKAKIAASRAICVSCAVATDMAEHAEDADERAAAKRREELLTPVAKAWSTDIGVEVASLGVQVHGGMGYIEETGAAQHLRDARITPIYEGTNAIQAIDLVGRKLNMDGGAAFDELFSDIGQTIEACTTSSHPDLPPLGDRLQDSLDAMREAVDWLKEVDMKDRLAGATPFLTLAGETIGGWLLCVGAVAARRRQKENIGDPAFAAQRIALANFYAEAVMTLAPSRVDDVTMGAEMIDEVGFGV